MHSGALVRLVAASREGHGRRGAARDRRALRKYGGAVALVDDVALLAASRDGAAAMLGAVALWCWRRRYLLSLKKRALMCAGPGCSSSAALGTRVAWRWSPPPPVAPGFKPPEWTFAVVRVVKYLGVQLTSDLSFDDHVEQSANRAAGELEFLTKRSVK